MGNMHLLQVHLKWANVWLLVVSAVIVPASPVVPHFPQGKACGVILILSERESFSFSSEASKEKQREGRKLYEFNSFSPRLLQRLDSHAVQYLPSPYNAKLQHISIYVMSGKPQFQIPSTEDNFFK
ncbi:unnamed protein product [Sphenostylis stenocarpa]|uniref:Uncharacterized protein n=1 Tax=Sphenostylis stenocarpa TaxID=92480 RepID=A0AA86V8Z3_9FABA|nr:unnamed protein product [Sphenostylis stenocarpa]